MKKSSNIVETPYFITIPSNATLAALSLSIVSSGKVLYVLVLLLSLLDFI